MKNTYKIALSGVITALSVVLLALGSVIWIFAYVAPLLCGLIMIIMTESAGKKYALTVYFAVSLLSLFLLSDKECALLYALFFGYYPIIREYLERIRSRVLSFLSKLALFYGAVVLCEAICIYVFAIPLDNVMGAAGIILMLVLAGFIFTVYDFLFNVAIILYNKKYRKIFEKFLK